MDSLGVALGESGRVRAALDSYKTPAVSVAALAIGLRRAGIALPPLVLDPCGGSGDPARALIALEPGVRVMLTDLNPDPGACDLYAVADMSLDATNVDALQLGLRLSGARAIISNPPFARRINPRIVAAGLELLRQHRLEFMALMAKTSHALDCSVGFKETAAEPLFAGTIACVWRTELFEPLPDEPRKRGKFSHCWHLWTHTGRGRLDSYPLFPVSVEEARALLSKGFELGDEKETVDES
jgi:hypothetical protein